jgi:hypothetical protein
VYLINLEKTLENQIQQEQDYNKLVDEVRKDNISKANQTFNSNSEGFGYEIINEDKSIDKIIYKPENMDEARIWHSDLQNLNNKFFDESGKITNVKEFHAIAEIARIGVQKYTEHIAKTAQANLIERQDKISKNIQPEILKPQYQTVSTGITFTVEK